MQKYAKFITVLVGIIIAYLLQRYGATAWIKDVELLASAAGVYAVPNAG